MRLAFTEFRICSFTGFFILSPQSEKLRSQPFAVLAIHAHYDCTYNACAEIHKLLILNTVFRCQLVNHGIFAATRHLDLPLSELHQLHWPHSIQRTLDELGPKPCENTTRCAPGELTGVSSATDPRTIPASQRSSQGANTALPDLPNATVRESPFWIPSRDEIMSGARLLRQTWRPRRPDTGVSAVSTELSNSMDNTLSVYVSKNCVLGTDVGSLSALVNGNDEFDEPPPPYSEKEPWVKG